VIPMDFFNSNDPEDEPEELPEWDVDDLDEG
jgi:hypothetical protein